MSPETHPENEHNIQREQQRLDELDAKRDSTIDIGEEREQLTQTYIKRVNDVQGHIRDLQKKIDVQKDMRAPHWQRLESVCLDVQGKLLERLSAIDEENIGRDVAAFNGAIDEFLSILKSAETYREEEGVTPEKPSLTSLEASISTLRSKRESKIDERSHVQDELRDIQEAIRQDTEALTTHAKRGDREYQPMIIERLTRHQEELTQVEQKLAVTSQDVTMLDIQITALQAQKEQEQGNTREADRLLIKLKERFGSALSAMHPGLWKKVGEAEQRLLFAEALSDFEQSLLRNKGNALQIAVEQQRRASIGEVDFLDQYRGYGLSLSKESPRIETSRRSSPSHLPFGQSLAFSQLVPSQRNSLLQLQLQPEIQLGTMRDGEVIVLQADAENKNEVQRPLLLAFRDKNGVVRLQDGNEVQQPVEIRPSTVGGMKSVYLSPEAQQMFERTPYGYRIALRNSPQRVAVQSWNAPSVRLLTTTDLAYVGTHEGDLFVKDGKEQLLTITNIGDLEKQREEQSRDVLRALDRDPSVQAIVGKTSAMQLHLQSIGELLSSGTAKGAEKAAEYVEYARSQARPLLALLNDPQFKGQLQAVKQQLQTLERTQFGFALGGIEREIVEQIDAIDDMVAVLENPDIRRMCETILDKSKFHPDTWAHWWKTEGVKFLAAIIVATAAIVTIVATFGAATPLWAIAGAGAAGGIIGSELAAEGVHLSYHVFDADVRSGKATFSDRSILGKYFEDQKVIDPVTGKERDMSFIFDVVNPYAQQFFVNFLITYATLGAGRWAAGKISLLAQNSKWIQTMTQNGGFQRMTQSLERIKAGFESIADKSLAHKIVMESLQEIGEEATEGGIRQGLNRIDARLGVLAGFLVATALGIRVRSRVRGFGVEVPHGTSIEQAQQTLKVQLEAQGHSTKISGDTMVVTMWNGEKMEVEFLHVAENSNASEETVTSETDVEQVHSDISETLSESQLESNEAQSQELSPEVVTARENLRAQLEKSGEILPPEHPASQFLMRVTNRLGKPDDIAVICLDSEAWMAGYEPSSRTVVVSREFLRTVVKSIPDASEDHVAAVLAHELEHRHADVKEWEKAKKPFTNPTAYFSANFNHSEELRADAEGMEQLARTGYDPMAMIEMLDKVLGVGSGRGDRAHPETIDRIRHLENRLADDEHPIANIGKEHTPFDPELLNWIEQKSEVYDKTDELLSMNDEQLADALGSAETVEEFWTVLKVIKHREAVGEAKAIAGEDRLRGLYTNMIALEALESLCKCKVLNFEGDTDSELRKTEWARALNDAANKTQSPYKIRLESSVGLNDVLASSGHVERALRSASDREKTDTHELSSADRERLSEDLAKAEAYVQEKLQQLLSAAEEQQLPPREQHFLEHIKQTLESGQISPEILRAVYAGYDQEYVQQKRAKEDTERSERGMRGHDTAREPLTRDLRNPDVRERLEKDLELTVALHFAGKPEVSEEMVANLQNLLEKQHNLDSQSASALSRILLEGGSTQEWEQFTKAQSNDVLVRIIDALDHLPQSGFMRISPVRRSHDAYKASEENLPLVHSATHRGGSVRYRDYSFTDYSGVEAMQYIAGWELLSRGHPDGHLESQKQFLPPDQVTLSPAEWKAVTNAGVRGTESLMTTKAIQTFVEAGGDISKIPDEFREALQTSSSLPENLKPNELLTLLEHNPWDSDKLQVLIKKPVEQLVKNADKIEDKATLLQVLEKLHTQAKEEPCHVTDMQGYLVAMTPNGIAQKMLDLNLIEENKRVDEAVAELAEQGVCDSLYCISDNAEKRIAELSTEELHALAGEMDGIEGGGSFAIPLSAALRFTAEVPAEQRAKALREMHFSTSMIVVEELSSKYGMEERVEKIITTLKPGIQRDYYLVSLYERVSDQDAHSFANMIRPHLVSSPDAHNARQKATFSNAEYVKEKHTDEETDSFRGEGILHEQFPDLLQRRHSFATQGQQFSWKHGEGVYKRDGHPYQKFMAKELALAEEKVLSDEPVDTRLQHLVSVASTPSVVRDIYVERIFRNELAKKPSNQEIVALGEKLLPLFSRQSELRDPFAIRTLEATIAQDKSVIEEYEKGRSHIEMHLPEPSLARNYFLDQLEANARLTPAQLEELRALRVTPEGQKQKGESSPAAFIHSKLAESNREERMKTYMWMTGISSEKPKNVLKLEEELDGHADNFPAAFASLTSSEQEVMIKRLCLGDEGILDTATVVEDQKEAVDGQRRLFLEKLSEELFPSDVEGSATFRSIFVNVITEAEPAKGAQLLSKLTSQLTKHAREGTKLDSASTAALVLGECGVVGKKVAQSLAELPWVPADYKEALKTMQSDAEVVHKRSLAALAEGNGLLDGSKGVKIVSFDSLLGAASNKQACLVTVEITDPSLGHPVGTRLQLVGKFKRPSAQKSQNVDHDIHLLETILTTIEGQQGRKSMPPGFSEGIRDAVTRELDFPNEAEFAKDIKTELAAKPKSTSYKVAVPDIVFSSPDVILETAAKGMSFREYLDAKKARTLPPEYQSLNEKAVSQTVLTESLAQLLIRGNLHADLHPGNVFVAPDRTVTLIDLGMHERLTPTQRRAVGQLLLSLTTGSGNQTNAALKRLGWDTELPLKLATGDFAGNVDKLILASREATTPMPPFVSSIITSTSKLGTYAQGLSTIEASVSVARALSEGIPSMRDIVGRVFGGRG